MDNIESQIQELESEVRYQVRAMVNSQPGSLTFVIAKIRMKEAMAELDTLEGQ